MVGDLEHVWYFNYGRSSTPPHLLVINFTIPWYIWSNGPRFVCVFASGQSHPLTVCNHM